MNVINNLITNILENTPKIDIDKISFNNIKTELYAYQINNVNWMLNIENMKYTDEYLNIKNKIIFKGGGLFDEVGMGKTLQIITLINTNVCTNKSMTKNNKLFSKATLIIAPNHLCGQWSREFNIHISKSLNISTNSAINQINYLNVNINDFKNNNKSEPLINNTNQSVPFKITSPR